MPTQKWKVVVAKLGASSTLHESEVDAANWMSALRAARQSMSERPSLPPGASCTVDSQGVATILDPSSRRKFVLAPIALAPASATASKDAAAPAPVVRGASPAPEVVAQRPKQFDGNVANPAPKSTVQVAEHPAAPTEKHARLHSTSMDTTSRTQSEALEPSPRPPVPAPAQANKKKFDTVAFVDGAGPGVQREISVGAQPDGPSTPTQSKTPMKLDSLLERDEDPTPNNPLHYRERAYLLPKGASVSEGEAALRWKLAELQNAMSTLPRGKLVNLAVFDHRWQDAPERPPVIVLQWRDWRNEVTVDYPAAARSSSAPPPSSPPREDLLADVFEALEQLTRLHTAAEGLDFGVKLLGRMVPAEAIAACLYDINTDELRFVALVGDGSDGMQGKAVPRVQGLFGPALRSEHSATVFNDLRVEPAFEPSSDGRTGMTPRNALLRPIAHEHQLLGMLQLINRNQLPAFSAEDVSVVNYVAERLADFLYAARQRQRGLA